MDTLMTSVTEIEEIANRPISPAFECSEYDNGPSLFGVQFFMDGREVSGSVIVREANRQLEELRAQLEHTRRLKDELNERAHIIGRQQHQIAWLEAQLDYERAGRPQEHEHTFVFYEMDMRCPCGATQDIRF